MKFSVIIPTYNEEKYISSCLVSIKNQHYDKNEFEIIVADACSTDNTITIAKKYADKIVQTEKRGISVGRNLGASVAQGEILLFVDADAKLEIDFLMQCENSFKNEKVVGVTGIAYPIDGKLLQRLVYKGTYVLVRLFNYINLSLFPGICVAYRKSVYKEVNGFREDFGIVEDLDLSRRISRFGKCVVNTKARAYVSTRRLQKNLFSTVLFHIYCDIRYLISQKAPGTYLKTEEVNKPSDLWKQLKK